MDLWERPEVIDLWGRLRANLLERVRTNYPLLTALELPLSVGASDIAASLAPNTVLTALDLLGHGIGDAGVGFVAQALLTNKGLRTLCLAVNDVGPPGARCLSEALLVNSTLTALDIGTNAIGDAGAHDLARGLACNNVLTMLDLTGNAIGPAGASSLGTMLAQNRALRHLNLGSNRICAPGLRELAHGLANNITIKSLHLWRNSLLLSSVGPDSSFDETGFQALVAALTSNSTVTQLDLRQNLLDDQCMRDLAPILRKNTLVSLSLASNLFSWTGTRDLIAALGLSSALRSLDLSNNSLGSRGALIVATFLESNTTLTALEMQLNGLANDGVAHLSAALGHNHTLRLLNIGDNAIDATGAHHIASALGANSTLKALYVEGNPLRAAGAQHLAAALCTQNRTLTTLSMAGCGMTCDDGSAQLIASMLGTNTSLTSVNLEGNFGNREDCSCSYAFGKALRSNTTLCELACRFKGIKFILLRNRFLMRSRNKKVCCTSLSSSFLFMHVSSALTRLLLFWDSSATIFRPASRSVLVQPFPACLFT
jgi:Ran GTPase-activating protein (RanGAP) involved in mRNA processing and transport